jgi:hypothetical protein
MTETKEISLTIPVTSGFTHVLFNLAAQGFEYIKIQYSGGGDSGCIDDVYLLFHGTATIEDGEVSESNDRDYAHPNQELKNLIEEKATNQVLDKADDWWNNEGCGGTLYISTLDGTYHGDHYVNETTTHDSTLTGKFGDN